MSTDVDNSVAAQDEATREEDTKNETKEKKTPRKRALSEKKEGERKSERAPKQITPFSPPEPKDSDASITIPAGKGTPIGEIPNCVTALKGYKTTDKFLGKLHRLMFGSGGKKRDFKQNIRLFKGFAPGEDRAKLLKKTTQSKLEMKDLKPICHVLDLSRSGTRDELIEELVDFLLEPKSSGNPYKRESSAGSTKKSKSKSSKKRKSSSGEGRPTSGYMMFVKVKRPSVVAKHPEASFGQIGGLLGEKWRKLTDSEKEEWAERGRKEGPKVSKKTKKTSVSKKSKTESSSSESDSSSEESSEEDDQELSDAIRAKIKSIVASGVETLTIRQIKEQLKTDFADEVNNKGPVIKAFVLKCVGSQ